MNPNIVLISPHFPPRFHFFAERLALRGARVLGITDQPDEALPPWVRGPLAGHYRVSSLHDTEEVCRAIEWFRLNFGEIHRVESHLESWLELEAELRERFDLFGLRPDRLGEMKRKSLMKAVFARAEIRTAGSALLADEAATENLIEQVGYPLIVKPDSGVGALDTHKIEDADQLQALVAGTSREGYLVEEFISGDIVTFDGLTGTDGEILFHTSHRYSEDARRIANESLDFYYWNERELPEDLEAAGRAVIEDLAIPEKFFHLEFFRKADGELLGIELNIRPPGGFTTDMFNFAHDIDVYDLWAAVVCGDVQRFEYARPYHCASVLRRRRFHYALSHREVLEMLGPRLCMHEELNPLYAQVMGEDAYLIRTPDAAELHELAARIHEKA